MRATHAIVSAFARSSFALPQLAAQGGEHDLRSEIRKIIREEVRKAVHEALAEAHAEHGKVHRPHSEMQHHDAERHVVKLRKQDRGGSWLAERSDGDEHGGRVFSFGKGGKFVVRTDGDDEDDEHQDVRVFRMHGGKAFSFPGHKGEFRFHHDDGGGHEGHGVFEMHHRGEGKFEFREKGGDHEGHGFEGHGDGKAFSFRGGKGKVIVRRMNEADDEQADVEVLELDGDGDDRVEVTEKDGAKVIELPGGRGKVILRKSDDGDTEVDVKVVGKKGKKVLF